MHCISINIGLYVGVTASNGGFAAILAAVCLRTCSWFHQVGDMLAKRNPSYLSELQLQHTLMVFPI